MTHGNTLELEAVVGAGSGIHGKQQVPLTLAPGSGVGTSDGSNRKKDGGLWGEGAELTLETQTGHATIS
jgi:hypothetical protein